MDTVQNGFRSLLSCGKINSSIPKRCQEGHICAKHLWALFLDISPDPSSSLQHVRLRCAEFSDSWAFIKAVHFKQLSARCTQQIFSSSCTSFQQSRHVRTTGVACPAHRLARSPTASSGPQTGALAPTAVARVSPPAPQTGTGLVACRLRPGCAKSGRARLCCRGSEGCSRSVHNQHTISSSHWFHCSNTCLNTIFSKLHQRICHLQIVLIMYYISELPQCTILASIWFYLELGPSCKSKILYK